MANVSSLYEHIDLVVSYRSMQILHRRETTRNRFVIFREVSYPKPQRKSLKYTENRTRALLHVGQCNHTELFNQHDLAIKDNYIALLTIA